MDTKEIEQIVHRILNALNEKSNTESVLLVFCGGSRYALEKFLIEANEIGKTSRIKAAVDKSAVKLLPAERFEGLQGIQSVFSSECEDFDQMFEGVHTVVFGNMDINTAAKIAHLLTDSLAARIASEAFIRGIHSVSNTFGDGIEIKNESYAAAVGELIKKLSRFGMEFMPVESISNRFKTHPAVKVQMPLKIITEDVVNGLKGSELCIDKDAVVTPLAKDAIREKKVVLTRGRRDEHL